MKFVCWVFTKY